MHSWGWSALQSPLIRVILITLMTNANRRQLKASNAARRDDANGELA
jgi:hypothetical protein